MNTNPAHIVLRNVRLSYVHLDQPYTQQPGQEPKYSAVVLVPKQPPENRAAIDAAIAAAAQAGQKKFGAAFPAQPRVSVHDGDGPRPSDNQPYSEECRGCWVFTASNKTRPRVVDVNLQDIIEPTEIYSGMYANVGVTFFPYSAPQNKGVGVALDNVQKIADGEPLGGNRASAEDDFASAGAQQYPQAPAYQSPAPGYGTDQYAQQYPPQPDYGVPGYPQYPQA